MEAFTNAPSSSSVYPHVLIPTTSPRAFTRGPPLFPPAMAAEWMTVFWPLRSTTALTVPSVYTTGGVLVRFPSRISSKLWSNWVTSTGNPHALTLSILFTRSVKESTGSFAEEEKRSRAKSFPPVSSSYSFRTTEAFTGRSREFISSTPFADPTTCALVTA
ncbi:MAG: hypothetical protein BWY99_02636 [Synergistetes bacterium ADurb.BinA166]|nr:MAG: hypothetical protein BWY99_02636 [Synergistetes bacterium ADurb.BinA166]